MTINIIYVDSYKAWSVTFSVFMINALIIGFIKIYALIIAEFQDVLDLPLSLLMVASGLLTSITGFMGPIGTILAEKITVRYTGIITSILSTISLLLMAYSNEIAVQILSTIILGISFGLIYSPSSVMSHICHIKHQTLSQAIIISGSSFGSIIFPFIITILLPIYSLKGVIVVYAGIFCNITVSSFLLPNRVIDKREKTSKVIFNQQFMSNSCGNKISGFLMMKQVKFKRVWLYIIGMSFVMNGFMANVALFGKLAKHFEFNIISSSEVLIGLSIIDLISRIIGGFMVDRFKLTKWIVYCINGFVFSIVSFLPFLTPSLTIFYIYAVVSVLCGGSMMVLHILILTDQAGLQEFKGSYSVYLFVMGSVNIPIFYAIGKLCEITCLVTVGISGGGFLVGSGCLSILLQHLI